MRISFLLFFISFYFSSFSQFHYKINGKVLNNSDTYSIKNGDTIFFRIGDEFKTVLQNNAFHFSGELKEPIVGFISFKGAGIKLLLDSSDYQVNINVIDIVNDNKKYKTYQYDIETKSSFHNLWKIFYSEIEGFSKMKKQLNDSLKLTLDVLSTLKIKNKIDSIPFLIKKKYNNLSVLYPDNYATPYILFDAPDLSYSNYILNYQMLTIRVKKSTLGLRFLERLNDMK